MGIFSKNRALLAAATAKLAALDRVQAVIEFDLEGTIITANQAFLDVMGYDLAEIVGKHHSMFAEAVYVQSPEYKAFWEKLRRGEFETGRFKRLGKGRKEVWIQASYNPILDAKGRPVKVVKFATDVTESQLRSADYRGQIEAISKSQAVIEFTTTGEILGANANFLATLGYGLAEIVGRHHSMFVEPDYARSADYATFWQKLGRGEFQAAEYKRVGKGGREVWLQAAYNPIFDLNGQPYKVVKFAADITGRKIAVAELSAGLQKLAGRDLDAKINTAFVPDFEDVRTAYNQTVGQFTEIVAQLRTTSRGLRIATGEILSGANDLSERTTRQAATIEETSATMEQLATTVINNAKRAREANDETVAVSQAAETGGQVMHRATEAMERIRSSSAKISNIISLIDNIAFQTNLLALNASVEAARAGEAGKGFAVVAVEVRRLAQSAAQASADVKSLIEQSSGEVATGSKLVGEASDKLLSIVKSIQENGELMRGIAADSQEQAAAIEQVNVAVRQLDEMTQHNAALVEKTSAAIEQTETQATELDKIVDVFRLVDHAKQPERLRLVG